MKDPALGRWPRTGRNRLALMALGVWLLLYGAAWAQDQGIETVGRRTWWLHENVFPATRPIDTLFYGILYLTCAVGLGVFVVLIAFLIKYRHRPGRHAKFVHGNGRLEAVWTLVPTGILVVTAAFSQATWSSIKTQPPVEDGESVVRMEVVGKQFQWFFHYPGKDSKLGPRRPELIDPRSSDFDRMIGLDRTHPDARDDIVSPTMYIPVNRRVYITLSSVDVLHSFFLPNFRVKLDAVPGLHGRLWINAAKSSAEVEGCEPDGSPRPFDIVCAELCGQGHFKMRGQLYAVSDEEFEKFIEEETSYLDLGAEGEDSEGY